MKPCRCQCAAPGGDRFHLVADALADDDLDGALELGLLEVDACPGCTAACTTTVLAVRDARRTALSARDRFRARNARLERRAAERAARRAAPPAATTGGTGPALPPAAADALARALAKAGLKR